MSIELVLYLIDIFQSINGFAIVGLIFYLFVTIIIIGMHHFAYYDYEKEKATYFLNILKNKLWIVFLSIFLCIFIPSQKTMYLMLGANFLKNSSLPSKVEMAIEKKIDEYLVEDKENK